MEPHPLLSLLVTSLACLSSASTPATCTTCSGGCISEEKNCFQHPNLIAEICEGHGGQWCPEDIPPRDACASCSGCLLEDYCLPPGESGYAGLTAETCKGNNGEWCLDDSGDEVSDSSLPSTPVTCASCAGCLLEDYCLLYGESGYAALTAGTCNDSNGEWCLNDSQVEVNHSSPPSTPITCASCAGGCIIEATVCSRHSHLTAAICESGAVLGRWCSEAGGSSSEGGGSSSEDAAEDACMRESCFGACIVNGTCQSGQSFTEASCDDDGQQWCPPCTLGCVLNGTCIHDEPFHRFTESMCNESGGEWHEGLFFEPIASKDNHTVGDDVISSAALPVASSTLMIICCVLVARLLT